MPQTNNILLRCDCSAHILEVMKFEGEDEFYFEVFSHADMYGKPPLKERIKNAWKSILGNPLCVSETILSNSEAKKLQDFLNTYVKWRDQ